MYKCVVLTQYYIFSWLLKIQERGVMLNLDLLWLNLYQKYVEAKLWKFIKMANLLGSVSLYQMNLKLSHLNLIKYFFFKHVRMPVFGCFSFFLILYCQKRLGLFLYRFDISPQTWEGKSIWIKLLLIYPKTRLFRINIFNNFKYHRCRI